MTCLFPGNSWFEEKYKLKNQNLKKLVRQANFANFAIVAPNDYTVSELRENEFKRLI